MTDVLFTPAAVLDMLSQIDELRDYELGLEENDLNLVFTIGDSRYEISGKKAPQVHTDSTNYETAMDADDECLYQLAKNDKIDIQEDVEGGIIKETVKTLLVGGLVRLTSGLVK